MELDLDISTEGQDPTNVPIQDWAIDYSEQTNVTEMYRKILDSITFPNGSIEFGMTTVESEYGSNNRTLFNLIIVKDHNNNTVNTYNLRFVSQAKQIKVSHNLEFREVRSYPTDTNERWYLAKESEIQNNSKLSKRLVYRVLFFI